MPKRPWPTAAIVIRAVAAILAVSLFFEPGARALLHLDGSAGQAVMTPAFWISLLAPIFFLRALWMASDAIIRMDRGDEFGPAVVRGLKHIGGNLMLGAFAAVIAEPSLTYLFANGFTEMRGVQFDLSIENLTLALIGSVLFLLARQGQQLQSKLDEFV